MKLYTIGFTRKSAERFFHLLRDAGVRRVVDVRLNNTSQLAGFTKQDDLRFFLDAVAGIDYIHLRELAPTEDLMNDYKKSRITAGEFESRFTELMQERDIGRQLQGVLLDGDCLLCSEAKPQDCHRSLIADYLKDAWGDIEVVHLQ